jgi:hypothetical protein
MSSCCTRKRTWKDFAFLAELLGLITIMGVAYAL